MPAPKPKTFRTRIELVRDYMNWTIARVPFNAAEAWPEMQKRRVRGTLNGISFRTALLTIAKGDGDVIVVYKLMQRAAKVRPGDEVEIRLEPDLEERPLVIPDELTRILKAEPGLRRWFNKLSQSDRRSIGIFIDQAKSAASREKRAEQMAERLMLAMEGEIELPPLLKVAFQRQPLAGEGWRLMTPVQRRRHLLGIFYYRTPESRQRRAQAAIDEAIARVNKLREARSASEME